MNEPASGSAAAKRSGAAALAGGLRADEARRCFKHISGGRKRWRATALQDAKLTSER